MRPTAIVQSHVAIELKSSPIEASWILEGSPIARNSELSSSRDGQAMTLVWDCTPGKFMWHYDQDETVHILEGRVVLDEGIGAPRQLGPGDVVFVPAGASVKWHVEEHVRKLAFFRRALPRPVGLAMGAMRRIKQLVRRCVSTDRFALSPVRRAVCGTPNVPRNRQRSS